MNRMPGFTAQASAYRSSGRYYIGAYVAAAPVADGAIIRPAQGVCPPQCVRQCVTACQHDGLSLNFCQRLCQADCTAYSSGIPLHCTPCTRTCTYCGGETATSTC